MKLINDLVGRVHMDYGKEKKQLKGEKSRRNLFMVFMCEVAVLILIGVIFTVSCTSEFLVTGPPTPI